MQCTSPVYIKGVIHPCGRCMHCRVSRSREFANRCIHEMRYWESSCFLTLTYSDQFLPSDNSLSKRTLQLFFKRLRKEFDLSDRKLKHFSCGEYGERNKRPHYHSIIFGASVADQQVIESCWGFGFLYFGSVTFDSCRYVADYITKQLNGGSGLQYSGREPPFRLVSNGLGLRYVEEFEEQLRSQLSFTVRGAKQSLPRYYRGKLGLDKSCFIPGALEAQERALAKRARDPWELSGNDQRDLNLKAKFSLKDRDGPDGGL